MSGLGTDSASAMGTASMRAGAPVHEGAETGRWGQTPFQRPEGVERREREKKGEPLRRTRKEGEGALAARSACLQ